MLYCKLFIYLDHIWQVVYVNMFIYRVVTIVFSLVVAIGILVIAETYHDILYAK